MSIVETVWDGESRSGLEAELHYYFKNRSYELEGYQKTILYHVVVAYRRAILKLRQEEEESNGN